MQAVKQGVPSFWRSLVSLPVPANLKNVYCRSRGMSFALTPAGEHFETLFKENPDGTQSFDDAPDLVNMLRSNDDYAQRIAKNGLAFARKYLIKEVMLVYLRELLLAYKDLFEDMDEYVLGVGDPGSRALFLKQAEMWKEDWRTVRV